MNIESYLVPAVARSLPAGSHERELASCALRNLWHVLFDPCPNLLALYPPDGKLIMEPFLEWARLHSLSMTWSMHIHFLRWLLDSSKNVKELESIHKRELIVAAVLRWATSNMSDVENIDKSAIVIQCMDYKDGMIGARKAKSVFDQPQVKLLRSAEAVAFSEDCYAVVSSKDSWEHGEWMSIPV